MPELLGDKRNEWMQLQERLAQHEILDRKAGLLGRRILQLGLGDFHIPVAEIVPEKSIECLHRRAELELGKTPLDVAGGREQAGEDRVVVGVELRRVDARKD